MSFIRTFAKHALWQTGGYRLVAGARPWSGVAVLNYHGIRNAKATRCGTSEELHVRTSVFESHLRVVRALGTPISLAQWRAARNGQRPLPSRAVLVTFDDGYRSVKEFAVPLLERYEVPAVAFVCTGPPVSRELLWYDALERHGRAAEIEPAKHLPYAVWRQLVDGCRIVAREDDDRVTMTPDEIAALAQHPLVEIGAHTVDHPVLARADAAVQRQQIGESITSLRDWTGAAPRAFAYPNGRPGADFTAETIAIVRDLNIECAFSTAPAMASLLDSFEATPRFTMLDSMTDAHLAQYLSMSWPRESWHRA